VTPLDDERESSDERHANTNDFLVFILAAGIWLELVNVLESTWWTAFIGGQIFEVVGALRAARPGSWWDRHWSSPAQWARAAKRFARIGDAKLAPL
jgi:hypothetical protein